MSIKRNFAGLLASFAVASVLLTACVKDAAVRSLGGEANASSVITEPTKTPTLEPYTGPEQKEPTKVAQANTPVPTAQPTVKPTTAPTQVPTVVPTAVPTQIPVILIDPVDELFKGNDVVAGLMPVDVIRTDLFVYQGDVITPVETIGKVTGFTPVWPEHKLLVEGDAMVIGNDPSFHIFVLPAGQMGLYNGMAIQVPGKYFIGCSGGYVYNNSPVDQFVAISNGELIPFTAWDKQKRLNTPEVALDFSRQLLTAVTSTNDCQESQFLGGIVIDGTAAEMTLTALEGVAVSAGPKRIVDEGEISLNGEQFATSMDVNADTPAAITVNPTEKEPVLIKNVVLPQINGANVWYSYPARPSDQILVACNGVNTYAGYYTDLPVVGYIVNRGTHDLQFQVQGTCWMAVVDADNLDALARQFANIVTQSNIFAEVKYLGEIPLGEPTK